ncbi:2-C-methyl-D-erythritol 4-phosphate cytidylyltransferase [Candidatus Paracaedibacter acanthamoebae]|uniref:2-C-methyl-D-erythritol 2,4-cyclodiphosphate synthase n=1 Tax=Candidatus Odyssella acanthamoebae TaxID=91604 RepID=A0A077AYW3_9PROT|nr:2-C-methyl-D-erythritol 2,4-cyclodiphosphate synthase [Candidatus Paracaedibacter acanthamoebae]AIK96823.1 2-C-methyl-D-erythritol 4-phosphate cytidylyltransferase [Candidatus Paracaedibacter acanthamoebae]
MDIRVGNGFDVHAIGQGEHVIICGVKIPCGFSLIGHSDADVGLHALTDAILGALCLGDIGQHFPPNDPRWKGADSTQFLKHAAQLAQNQNYRINHVDVTIIGEAPKVSPHRDTMRQKISQILEIDKESVSVKATTTEKLGFTGRGEGLAALATATLIKQL